MSKHSKSNTPKSLNMQSENILKPKMSKKNQINGMQRDVNSCNTDFGLTQENGSKSSIALESGLQTKGGKQRQHRKIEKPKLKDSEQEEQLKLACSLISNLERKVGELENTNRILNQDLSASTYSHPQTEQSNTISSKATYANVKIL